MTAKVEKILQDALALPDEERMDLLTALSDSFEPPAVEFEPEWRAKIADRIGQIERGEVEPVEWDEVETRIRATLARRG